jgi:formate-dependent nitrite reductase membrane component NrfD
MDPKVNGQLQHEWGWLIAIYLFLGGVGGGAYTSAAINSFLGESPESVTVGLWIGFPALLIGTIFLILDLGTPTKAFLAGMKPGTSWIARGTWIIALFMVFSFVHLVLHHFTTTPNSTKNLVGAAGIIFAIGTMAYTGILLSAAKGIPFWRTGVVPVVFVISAMVTGHFTVILGMIFFFGDTEGLAAGLSSVMAKEAAILVVLEVLAIFFFLHAAFRTPDSRESAERILKKTTFVAGYFVVGLALPLVLSLVLLYGLAGSGASTVKCLAANAALFGLIGGLLLRQGVLVCGTMPTLNIGGFQFRRIARPKDPKAGIGTLPPQ